MFRFRGPEAELALAVFQRQMEAWGIPAPPVEPLLLDFGLGQFDRVGLVECWIANELDAGYCGKYLFVFDGQQCPAHSHRRKHETFFLIRGRLNVVLDARRLSLEPGQVLPIPTGRVHSFQGEGNSLLLEVSMTCCPSDNDFENPQIRDWLMRYLSTHKE